MRKLEGILRLAEAAARVELSSTIEAEHVQTATQLVGESMQEFGKNEDGDLDTDVIEADEEPTALWALEATLAAHRRPGGVPVARPDDP